MTLAPELKAKIDTLITANPVVLFMKGTRSFPQCGFSSTVVNLLNGLVPSYTTVNILSDEEIRTGMKLYSDWPTFPQLYIKGEFVGGCDIVKAMYDKGELQALLGDLAKPKAAPNFTVTPAAQAKLREALSPGEVVHFSIAANFEQQLDIGDVQSGHVSVTIAGIPFQLDPQSAVRSEGVVIDFERGPQGEGFAIENPNRPK